jgi:hypothetical protein
MLLLQQLIAQRTTKYNCFKKTSNETKNYGGNVIFLAISLTAFNIDIFS